MTTIQDEALDKALTLLGEHFDNVVIVCDAQDIEFPSEDGPSIFTRHKGSSWTCCGLMGHYTEMMRESFMATKDRGDD